MESLLFKHVRSVVSIIAGIVLTAAILWIGVQGIDRSLWLDEAWVANSIRATDLGEMFRGGEWLQTSPPLFLLAARVSVRTFGLSTAAFRIVPLLFATIAAGAMWFASRRVAPTLTPLVVGALILPSLAIEYFMSFKQYGAEAAAAGLVLWAAIAYLQSPGRRQFAVLTVALVGVLPLAYPLVFLVPGIVIAVFHVGGWRRATILKGGVLAMLGGLYVYFMRPNISPSLWQYWSGGFADAYSAGVWLLIAAGLVLTIRAAKTRNYEQLICLLPCLLLVVAERVGFYPASPRTRLFIRPCAILAAAMFAEEFIASWRWGWVQPVGALVSIAWALSAAWKYQPEPVEDYVSTIAYLREHVAPQDLLIVHADAREGMKLYAAMENWDLPARYGNTGWPCCPRHHSPPSHATVRGALPDSDEMQAARDDVDGMVPRDFRGRVWLVFASRWLHWRYIGIDEGELWRVTLWSRGCPPVDYVVFVNMVIAPMNCAAIAP
jgi:hypothetical protein